MFGNLVELYQKLTEACQVFGQPDLAPLPGLNSPAADGTTQSGEHAEEKFARVEPTRTCEACGMVMGNAGGGTELDDSSLCQCCTPARVEQSMQLVYSPVRKLADSERALSPLFADTNAIPSGGIWGENTGCEKEPTAVPTADGMAVGGRAAEDRRINAAIEKLDDPAITERRTLQGVHARDDSDDDIQETMLEDEYDDTPPACAAQAAVGAYNRNFEKRNEEKRSRSPENVPKCINKIADQSVSPLLPPKVDRTIGQPAEDGDDSDVEGTRVVLSQDVMVPETGTHQRHSDLAFTPRNAAGSDPVVLETDVETGGFTDDITTHKATERMMGSPGDGGVHGWGQAAKETSLSPKRKRSASPPAHSDKTETEWNEFSQQRHTLTEMQRQKGWVREKFPADDGVTGWNGAVDDENSKFQECPICGLRVIKVLMNAHIQDEHPEKEEKTRKSKWSKNKKSAAKKSRQGCCIP